VYLLTILSGSEGKGMKRRKGRKREVRGGEGRKQVGPKVWLGSPPPEIRLSEALLAGIRACRRYWSFCREGVVWAGIHNDSPPGVVNCCAVGVSTLDTRIFVLLQAVVASFCVIVWWIINNRTSCISAGLANILHQCRFCCSRWPAARRQQSNCF